MMFLSDWFEAEPKARPKRGYTLKNKKNSRLKTFSLKLLNSIGRDFSLKFDLHIDLHIYLNLIGASIQAEIGIAELDEAFL